MSEEELETEEPSVLSAREAMSLIGEDPAESEQDDEGSEEASHEDEPRH